MSLQFQRKRIEIPSGRSRREIPGSFQLNSRVLSSEIMLGGFKFDFEGRGVDHKINEIEINPVKIGSSPPRPNDVLFQLECQYADKNFDDRWSGYVYLIVLADVE